MQTKKMNLVNIHGKLSRAEMKNIMAGSGSGPVCAGGCVGGKGGAWNYTNPNGVSMSSCISDTRTYCSSNTGYCTIC